VAVAGAAPLLTLSGFLNDQANTSLVGSGSAPDAPLFGDDVEVSNNVAVYALTVGSAATVTFDSNGFDAGGLDPYFTLFAGNDPVTATVLTSNFAQAFSAGGDFLISLPLAAGDYLFAIGAFANMSLAENLGAGTLADGFVALGQPDLLGSLTPYYYELAVTDDRRPPVPEPSVLALLGAGGLALAGLRVRSRT